MGDTLKLRLLSSDQVSTMREKCLYLLSTLGMRIDHDGALDLLADAGADVDRETHVVSFPVDLIETALATVPRELIVKGADPSHDCPIPHPAGLFYSCTNIQSMLHHDVDSKRFEDNTRGALRRVVPDHRDPGPRRHLRHPDADGRPGGERRGPRAQHPDAEHDQAALDARLQPRGRARSCSSSWSPGWAASRRCASRASRSSIPGTVSPFIMKAMDAEEIIQACHHGVPISADGHVMSGLHQPHDGRRQRRAELRRGAGAHHPLPGGQARPPRDDDPVQRARATWPPGSPRWRRRRRTCSVPPASSSARRASASRSPGARS